MPATKLFAAQATLHHTSAVLRLDVVEHAALVRVGEATGRAHEMVDTKNNHHFQQVVLKSNIYVALKI